jgi:hypothetical protein
MNFIIYVIIYLILIYLFIYILIPHVSMMFPLNLHFSCPWCSARWQADREEMLSLSRLPHALYGTGSPASKATGKMGVIHQKSGFTQWKMDLRVPEIRVHHSEMANLKRNSWLICGWRSDAALQEGLAAMWASSRTTGARDLVVAEATCTCKCTCTMYKWTYAYRHPGQGRLLVFVCSFTMEPPAQFYSGNAVWQEKDGFKHLPES